MASVTNEMAPSRIATQQLLLPGISSLLLLVGLLYVVAFDQGALASLVTERLAASGGVLHEFFHDARHLIGVPCH